MDITLAAIGVIHTPFTDPTRAPIQASRSTAAGDIAIFPQFVAGLRDLDEFSHIFLLYLIECTQGDNLIVKPFLDDLEHGIFATRYPCRPNSIGLSIVRLLRVEGNHLDIEGVDMLDGSPCWTSNRMCLSSTLARMCGLDGTAAGHVRNCRPPIL